MVEIFVQPPQYAAPFFVVVDQLAEGVEHVASLVVHVSRSAVVDVVLSDDGSVVLYELPGADHVIAARFFAEVVVEKQVL